jgi:phosphate transport system substrate-binding protein
MRVFEMKVKQMLGVNQLMAGHIAGIRGKYWLLTAILAAFGMAAAACGGDDPTATATQSSGGQNPTATTSNSDSMVGPGGVNYCPQQGVTNLTGAGATFPFPLYSQMFDEYDKLCGVQVNYQSIGSGGGQRQLIQQTVDFGGSDGIMSDESKSQAAGPVLHVPVVAGALAVIYNLQGISSGELKLTSDVLAAIYLKDITAWDDPQIAALNPGVDLPDSEIAVVHRSDGSGTTFIFTNYLSKVNEEWAENVGFSSSVDWPGDIGGQGNEGVAQQVRQIPGAIGYVELAYAKQNNLAWAALQNKAGSYIEPSLEAAALAADVPNLPDNMEVVITDTDNPQGYSIVGFTWLLIYEDQTNAAIADAVARMAWWMIHDGQQYAAPLEYVPLEGVAVTKAENLIKKINVNGVPVIQ